MAVLSVVGLSATLLTCPLVKECFFLCAFPCALPLATGVGGCTMDGSLWPRGLARLCFGAEDRELVLAAVQEDAINYLTDFFAQIGIEDNEQLLAQL